MIIRSAAAALIALAVAAPAFAGERVIRKSEFDLSNPAEVARLSRTIEQEAKRVCDLAGRNTLNELVQERACVREAIADATEQAGLATVAADAPARAERAVIASN